MEEEIRKLQAEEKRIAAELREAQARTHYAICAQAGIKRGDIVWYKGKEYMVGSVDTWTWPRKLWVKGHMKKMDGHYSDRSINLYNEWQLSESDSHERQKIKP